MYSAMHAAEQQKRPMVCPPMTPYWDGLVQLAAHADTTRVRALFLTGELTMPSELTDHYLDHLQRIRQPEYSPTDDDVLMIRRPTTELQTINFHDTISEPGKHFLVSVTVRTPSSVPQLSRVVD